MKADPRWAEKNLKEHNLRRGSGPGRFEQRRSWRRNRWSDESPEGGTASAGAGEATRSQEDVGNDRRASTGDEPGELASGENP